MVAFGRIRAVLGVILSGGRVPINKKCPYCGATHYGKEAIRFHTDYRARLSTTGHLVCRECGLSLTDEECRGCGSNLTEPTEEADRRDNNA